MLVKRELEHTGVEPEEGQASQRKVSWLQRVHEQVYMCLQGPVCTWPIPWAPSKQHARVSISQQPDPSLTLTLLRWRLLHSRREGSQAWKRGGAVPLSLEGGRILQLEDPLPNGVVLNAASEPTCRPAAGISCKRLCKRSEGHSPGATRKGNVGNASEG